MSRNANGFTLLELLLYVSICGILLVGVVSFVVELESARVKQIAISEVEQQGQQVMDYMTRVLRNAKSVTFPTPGTSSTSLTLNVVDSTNSPTAFLESAGVMQVQEGGTAKVTALTSSTVAATNLQFSNTAYTGERDSITVQFTLSHQNLSGTSAYRYEKTFTDTIQLYPNN